MSDRDVVWDIRQLYISGWGASLKREELGVVVNYIVSLERIRDTHARRAALVAEWAEGLRAGKRYVVTVDGREWYAVRRGYWDEHHFGVGVTHATEGIEELAETSESRAAAYMLAVSDQWTEVE